MRICERCGETFVPTATALRNPRYRGLYCSRVCANKMRARPFRQRFEAFVTAAAVSKAGCWLWPGPLDRDGYGVIADDDRKQLRAPRVSYEISTGPIPEGKQIRHSCDVPACINPAHLSLGTSAQNAADRDERGRDAKGERHGRTHLTEDDVRTIRASAGTMSQQEIATRYGISQVTVSLLLRRKTWSHVE